MPPKGRLRGKHENWKFSINECEKSIVLIAPVSILTSLNITLLILFGNCRPQEMWKN